VAGLVVARQRPATANGVTFMLPTEDALWVGEELQRRFGLAYWQMALTATDGVNATTLTGCEAASPCPSAANDLMPGGSDLDSRCSRRESSRCRRPRVSSCLRRS